jgi:hypothetical protein
MKRVNSGQKGKKRLKGALVKANTTLEISTLCGSVAEKEVLYAAVQY